MHNNYVISFIQFRPARLAGLFFIFATLVSCEKDPFDALAKHAEGYGIAYPRFQFFQDLETVSIAYSDGKPTNSPITRYNVNEERPCITETGNRINIIVYCYSGEATNNRKEDRLHFVADFLTQGYDLLAEISRVPIIKLNLVEVSPEVTQAGFYLRKDIERRVNFSELSYFFPYIPESDKESKVEQRIDFAQSIYHELIHYAIWEKRRDPDTVLGNEFTAYFIANNVSKMLVFPNVLSSMRLEPPGEYGNGPSDKRMLQQLQDVESLDNFEPYANKNWKGEYFGVKKLARHFFWQLFRQARAKCILFSPIVKGISARLMKNPDSPSLVIRDVYEKLRAKHPSNVVCEPNFQVKESGSHFKGLEVVFR